MKEGEILRGIVINRMHVSEQTFSREFMTFLDIYPAIHYNRNSRKFIYNP